MSLKLPVKIAILGVSGLIGDRHLTHVLNEPQAELVALVDPAPQSKELAILHNVPCYESVDDLLRDRIHGKLIVDAAIVCTPTHTHISLGIKLVEAGIYALVEKPLAVDSSSGRQLVVAVEKSSAKVITGHHRRFHPQTMALRTAVQAGNLGQLVAVSGIWAVRKPNNYFDIPWRQQAGSGGPILTNLIHEIDLMRYIFGDIQSVFAIEGNRERGFAVEETVAITFKFVSGAVGNFIVSDVADSPHCWEFATGENSWLPKTGQTAYTVMGTRGTVSIPHLTRWHHDSQPENQKNWLVPMERDTSLLQSVDDVPPFTLQLQHFLAVVRGEQEPNCSAIEGLKDVLVIEAVFESLKTGQVVNVANE